MKVPCAGSERAAGEALGVAPAGDGVPQQPDPGGDVHVHLPGPQEGFTWSRQRERILGHKREEPYRPGLNSVAGPVLGANRAEGFLWGNLNAPCCLEKTFFCLWRRRPLSITGLKNVT